MKQLNLKINQTKMSDGEFQVPDEVYIDLIKRAIQTCEDSKNKLMTGVEKIAQERLEQKVKHHRSIKSDYELNADYQLVEAAINLLRGGRSPAPENWNEDVWIKMTLKSDEERLVIAGALIAAEIDRLNYKE